MSYTPDHQEPEVGLINTPYLLFFFPFSLRVALGSQRQFVGEGERFFPVKKKKRKLTLRGVTTDQVVFRVCLLGKWETKRRPST